MTTHPARRRPHPWMERHALPLLLALFLGVMVLIAVLATAAALGV